jgi:hypothetical protein
MESYLAIASSAKAVSFFQILSQRGAVVDFAVRSKDMSVSFVPKGLPTSGQVDNRKALMA